MITISTATCLAFFALLIGGIFLLTNHNASKTKSTAETIPLLNEKEIKLNDDTRLLREEQTKQQKLEENFRIKIKNIEKQTTKLEENFARQQRLEDELKIRVDEIEKRDIKLQEDVKVFQEKVIQQKQMKDELESRSNGMEKRETKLQEDVQVFQEKVIQQKQMNDELGSRFNEVEKQEKTLETDANSLREESVRQQNLEGSLNSRVKEIEKQETKLEEDKRLLEEDRIKQYDLEDSNKKRVKELEDREAAVIMTAKSAKDTTTESTTTTTTIDDDDDEDDTNTKEQDQQQQQREAITSNENAVEPEISMEESLEITMEESFSALDDEPFDRKKMIEKEVNRLVKQADENELEEPFDEDSIEALKKGALKICYVKRYYDVMKDEFINFPSVIQTIVDYRLIEEAEKFYFREEDEYPQDLSIGIRSVATDCLVAEANDIDEDYMNSLSQDIEL